MDTLPFMEPCGHAQPQADSQLHGVCIFCYRDRLAEASKRVEGLEGVVSKLPKTADGVPITPGMGVWFPGDDEPTEVDPGVGMVYDDETYQHPAKSVYSTREAALATTKEQE